MASDKLLNVQDPPGLIELKDNQPLYETMRYIFLALRQLAARTGFLTVAESDGDPSVPNVSLLHFDQADGFKVTDELHGAARINLIVPASPDVCPPVPETPSGTIDEINRVFTLSQSPPCSGFLERNRVYMKEGCDYDRSGPVITYVLGNAPPVGTCHVWTYV